METNSLNDRILDAVRRFAGNDGKYGDAAQLRISLTDGNVDITGSDEDEEGYDYYDVMDLVQMSTDNPGQWIPDEETIAEVSAQYAPEVR